MMARVFEKRVKLRSPTARKGDGDRGKYQPSSSLQPSDEDDGWWCGPGGDLPLTFCGTQSEGSVLGLKEVMRSSVEVLGMSDLGITEKIVLRDSSMFVAKRFRRASVGRSEFNRRVERVAAVCRHCQFLVPVRAHLYSKRTKLVLCDYYPMGSLADLLAGARDRGHTPLDWHTRAKIILHVARAISYIHSQPPADDSKRLHTNVHGNIKPSNVFVDADFSARVSDYGFTQLAEPVDVLDSARPIKLSPLFLLSEDYSTGKWSQKTDVFNFGVLLLDVLGGARAPHQIECVLERMEDIKAGRVHFFEHFVERSAKVQALRMLEVALACTNRSPEARPSADQILAVLTDVLAAGG